jgi:hypothetical protein
MKSKLFPMRPSLAGLALTALLSLSACGGGGGGDSTPAAAPPVAVTPPVTVTPPTTPAQPEKLHVSVVAGVAHNENFAQYADGKGSQARFYQIDGLVLDKSGTIFVNDAGNCVIRKIAPDGTVSTLAGVAGQCDYVDGAGAAARFIGLRGMTADAAGNLYVGTISGIRKVTPEGVVTTLAGGVASAFSVDGAGSAARFIRIQGIDMAPNGKLLVSDGSVNMSDREYTVCGQYTNILREVSLDGVVTSIPNTAYICGGSSDGPLMLAADLRFDKAGNLYLFHGTYLAKRSADGSASFILDDKGQRVGFASYTGNIYYRLAPDDAGNLFYVSDGFHKIAPNGVITPALAPDATDVPIGSVSALTYIGNHEFLLASNNQVVRITLK